MMQITHYCDHFKNLKISKNIQIDKHSSCRFCLLNKSSLWMCLCKGCELNFCDSNGNQHMKSHFEESMKKKSFHCIYINVNTACIICIRCNIQIYDLDRIEKNNDMQDPYPLRLKVLPALQDLTKNKITGQLENPEGHKKYNKGLTGLFGDKYNQIINTTIQFFTHCSFMRELLLQIKINQQNLILKRLQIIIEQLQSANFRAIRSDDFSQQIYKKKPQLYGYHRKDPFEIISLLLNLLHQQLKYYIIPINSELENSWDQWDILSANKQIQTKSPITDCLSLSLALTYKCQVCHHKEQSLANIDFLKLNISKKRRKTKQIQKDLKDCRYDSPLKGRRKSLINFILPTQTQLPITLQQLILNFLKQPFLDKKNCKECGKQMKNPDKHFHNLPSILIFQIGRLTKDGQAIDNTKVHFDSNSIDMGPFTSEKDKQIIYDFESAICFEKQCLFPFVCKNYINKQIYIFRNQLVHLLKEQVNPYIVCYRKRIKPQHEALYKNINSNITCQIQPDYFLPDFWLTLFKYGYQGPLKHQLVCRHNFLKIGVQTKMKISQKIPKSIYQFLIEKYGGQLYQNKICIECENQIIQLTKRKTAEKQIIFSYDKFKTNANCMIDAKWIKKWTDFLYKKADNWYFSKGYPLPGPIDNKMLLEEEKCRPNLRKNEDFKVINIFIWKFLKQLYGGGPEIRYKWKKDSLSKFDLELIKQVKHKAQQIKDFHQILTNFLEYPQKSSTLSFIQGIQEQQEEIH